jgi:hypothetical protein
VRRNLRVALLSLLGSLTGCGDTPAPSPEPAVEPWRYADAEKRPGVKITPSEIASPTQPLASGALQTDLFPPKSLPESLCPKRAEPKVEPDPSPLAPILFTDGTYRLADKTGFTWQSTDREALIEHVRRINGTL